MPESRRSVTRALLSVYDKSGLIDLARILHSHGVEIVSTGSTAKNISDAGIPVTPVESVTDFPGVPWNAGNIVAEAPIMVFPKPVWAWVN